MRDPPGKGSGKRKEIQAMNSLLPNREKAQNKIGAGGAMVWIRGKHRRGQTVTMLRGEKKGQEGIVALEKSNQEKARGREQPLPKTNRRGRGQWTGKTCHFKCGRKTQKGQDTGMSWVVAKKAGAVPKAFCNQQQDFEQSGVGGERGDLRPWRCR